MFNEVATGPGTEVDGTSYLQLISVGSVDLRSAFISSCPNTYFVRLEFSLR